jgi:hypothetical protein
MTSPATSAVSNVRHRLGAFLIQVLSDATASSPRWLKARLRQAHPLSAYAVDSPSVRRQRRLREPGPGGLGGGQTAVPVPWDARDLLSRFFVIQVLVGSRPRPRRSCARPRRALLSGPAAAVVPITALPAHRRELLFLTLHA